MLRGDFFILYLRYNVCKGVIPKKRVKGEFFMKKKLLVLFFILVMALSALSLTAYAATEISVIGVRNLRTPLAGSTPDYTIDYVNGNLVSKQIVDGQQVNGIVWYELRQINAGSTPVEVQMSKTDTFELGKSYRARIYVMPTGTAVFSNSVSARIYELTSDTPEMGYKTAAVTTPTGNTSSDYKVVTADYKCTVSAIDTVEITGLKIPRPGEFPDNDCNVLADGVYLNGTIDWSHKVGNNYESMNYTTAFETGETYKVTFWLRTEFENGYWFKTDSHGENVAEVLVNGIPCTICDTYSVDYVRGIECEFYVSSELISNIDIVGISTPIAGTVPDYEAAPAAAGYDIINLFWLDETLKSELISGGMTYVNAVAQAKLVKGDGKVFEEGHEYLVCITVQPQTGYEIDYDAEDYLYYAATVNGKQADEGSGYRGETASFDCSFGLPVIQSIYNVDVTGVEGPVAGKTPDYDAVCGADSYKLVYMFWVDNTEREALINAGATYVEASLQAKLTKGDGKTFKAGHAYSVHFEVEPCKNYEIDYDPSDNDVLYYRATVNGLDAKENSGNRGDNAGFSYAFAATTYLGISSVTADGFDAPVAGNTVDVIGSVAGTGIQLKKCYWYDLTAGKTLANDAKFEAGHKYRLIISVTAKENYLFATNDSGYPDSTKLTVTVNGNTATVSSTVGSATTMTFRYTYDHTCEFTQVKSKAPTCSAQGKNAYYKCSCGKFSEDSAGAKPIADIDSWGNIAVNASNHTYNTTTTKATLTTNGSIVTACTLCGDVKSTKTISYPKTIALSATTLTFNAYARTPAVTVKDADGKTLVKDTDYTVAYASGRRNVGTYNVTVTMKGNYTGTKTLSFKIVPMDISKCTVKLSATSLTYNAKVRTPAVTVTNANGAKLTQDTHYTVTYDTGRRNVGTYNVTVKLKGNYTGTKTLSFNINPMDISKCTVKLSYTSTTYNGNVRAPSVTVTNANGAKLTKDTHYTVTYASGRKNVGTYNVKVTMKGNYTGTKTLSFTIKPMDISKCTVKLSYTSTTYNGNVRAPSVTVTNANGAKLTKDTHYTVTYASGRKNVGTYNVTVTMKGNYTGTKTLSFTIKPINISTCTVKLSTTSYTYNGYVKTPTVTVTNSYGTKLTKDTHYTVSYATGRKNVGTYKVTVTMKGNYTGTKTLTFKINPPKTTVASLTAGTKSITVAVTKKTTQTTGYQIQYSTSKDFTNAKTKTITSNTTTKATLSSLTSAKTYYVRVRTYKTVNDVKYYSGWSEYKYVKTK